MTNISKSILLAGVILMALLCMIGTAAAAEEIREWSDFETVRENSGGEYILMANLDFNEADAEYPDGWIPLGTEDGPFTGKFDGNNGLYTISNLTLNEENYGDAAGFFGYVGEGATLENITLKKAKLTITNEAGPSVIDVSDIGLLAGNFSGTIENCQVDGEIIVYNDGGGAYNIGGLVGCLGDAEITDSSANVNIKITGVNNVYQVAGLIGYIIGTSSLENCNAAGNIDIFSNSGVTDIGGLTGYVEGTCDIESCYATGDIIVNAGGVSYIGGLVGAIEDGDMNSSYATGNIEIDSVGRVNNIGGLVGYNTGEVTDSYATGNIEIIAKDGVYNISGLVGYNTGEVTDSHAMGNIEIKTTLGEDEGSYSIGGLIGYNKGDVTDSYAIGDVVIKITPKDGVEYNNGWDVHDIGGLIGSNGDYLTDGGAITDSYADGDIDITINEAIIVENIKGRVYEIGGLIGYIGGTSGLENCNATGSIDISSTVHAGDIGGLTGYVSGTCDIESCYATGDITINAAGVDYVGGLVSDYNDGHISNSYATGDITITSTSMDDVYEIGGLVGENSGDITNSYTTGNIEIIAGGDVSGIGGIVGYNSGGDITNSYAAGNITIKTAGIDNVGGFIGYNTGEVTDSYATGSIKITAEYVLVNDEEEGDIGGLVGQNRGDIDNCYALNKEIILSGASSECIGKAVGYYSEGVVTNVRAWNGMRGEFTSESDEPEPITSAEVWNKVDWIGDDSTWEVNDYPDFRLPVPMGQEETTVADASHLNPSPSSRGGGSGTGSATVVNSTTNTSTNEGFGEEIDNGSSDAGDSGSSGGDDGSDSGDSSESGTNWTVIILVVAAVVVVAIAGGLYLYKAGKLKF